MFNSVKDVDVASIHSLEELVVEGDMQSILSKQLFAEYVAAHKIIVNIENLTECIAFAIKKKVEQQSNKEDIDNVLGEFMHTIAFDLGKEYTAFSEHFWVTGND